MKWKKWHKCLEGCGWNQRQKSDESTKRGYILVYDTWSSQGYASTHKGFFCYDANSQGFRVSRNVLLFEYKYLFPFISLESPGFVSLPNFLEVTHPIEIFKSGHVLVRQKLLLAPFNTELSSDPLPMESRRFSRISNPPKKV